MPTNSFQKLEMVALKKMSSNHFWLLKLWTGEALSHVQKIQQLRKGCRQQVQTVEISVVPVVETLERKQ